MAMSQMATVREVHSQNLLAILDCGQIHRHVCLCATVWLYVCVICTKQLFRAVDRCLLNNVGPLTTPVVTLSRITVGVLVRKDRTRSFEHRFTDKILRSDEFQSVGLASYFVVDSAGDDWIHFG